MAKNNGKYLKNVFKSLTQAGFDAITDFTPNVKADTKANIEFAKRTFAPMKEKLNQSKVNQNNFIVRETREIINNAVNDIRKGTIYNKSREKQARDKAFNKALGIDDLDFDNLFKDDETGGKGININNIVIDGGQDNDILSRGLSTVANTTASLMKTNAVSFGTISKQLSHISAFHNNNTIPFYNNMTTGLDTINASIREMSVQMEAFSKTIVAKDYKSKYSNNLMSQFFGAGMNIEEWKNIFNKRSGGGAIKDMKDIFSLFIAPELAAMKANPLGFLLKTGIKTAMPKSFKKSLRNLDELWETLPFLLQGKAKDWKKSENKIKNILGGFFDLSKNAQPSYRKYDYAKGAVRWDGVSRRALTNTIPGYLSKILGEVSQLTGNVKNRELLYDYETGKFVDRQKAIKKYRETNKSFSGMDGEISDFRNSVLKNAKDSGNLSEKDQIEFMKKTEKALEKLVKSGRGIGSADLKDISDDKFVAQYIKDTYNKLPKNRKNSLNRDQASKYVSYQEMLRNIVDEDLFQQVYDTIPGYGRTKKKETAKQKRERLGKKFNDTIKDKTNLDMSSWKDSDGNPFMEKVMGKIYDQLDNTDVDFVLDKNVKFSSSKPRSTGGNRRTSTVGTFNRGNYSNRGTTDFSGENSALLREIRDALRETGSVGFASGNTTRSDVIFENIDYIKSNTDSMVSELQKVNANLTNVFAANVNSGETPPGTDGNTFIRNVINKVKNGDYRQAYQTILNKFSPVNMIKKQYNSIKDFRDRMRGERDSESSGGSIFSGINFGGLFGKAKDKISNFKFPKFNRSGNNSNSSNNTNGNLMDIFGSIMTIGSNVFNSAKGGIKDLGTAGKNLMGSLFGLGSSLFNSVKGIRTNRASSGGNTSGSKINLGGLMSSGKDIFSSIIGGFKGINFGSLSSIGGAAKDLFGKLSHIRKEKEATKVFIEGGNLDGIRNVVYVREKLSDMNSAIEQRSMFGQRGTVMGPNGSFIMRDSDGKTKRKSLWDIEAEKDANSLGLLDYIDAADDISDLARSFGGSKIGRKIKGSKLGKGVGKILGKGKGVLGKGKGLLSKAFGFLGGGKLAKGAGKLLGKGKGLAGKALGLFGGKAAAKGVSKGLAKGAAKGVAKGAGKGLAKFIPGIGLALTGLFGIADTFSGWKNAGETFGVENATTGQKISSSVGSLLSGLTFGILNKDSVSKGLYGLGSSIGSIFGIGPKSKKAQQEKEQQGQGKKRGLDPLAALIPGVGIAGMLGGKMFSKVSGMFKKKDQTVPTDAEGMKDADSQRQEFNNIRNAKMGSVTGATAVGVNVTRGMQTQSTAEKVSSPIAKPLGTVNEASILGGAATMAAKRQRDKEREEDAIFQAKLTESENEKGEKALDPASRTAFLTDKIHNLFSTGTFYRLFIDPKSPFLLAVMNYLTKNGEGTGEGEGGTGGSNATGTFGGRGRLQYAPKAAVKDALNMIHQSESGGDPGKVSNTKGDIGGQSFGSYQFSRNMGSYKNLIKAMQSGDYGSQAKEWGDRLDAVYNDADASEKVWKEIAKENPQAFQDVQDQYWTEVYFERDFVNPLKAKTGFDVLTRSNGLIARAMSIANQFGPAMSNGGAGQIFANAVKKAGGNSASDKDILNNVQAYVSSRTWDANINAGMHARFKREHEQTMKMLNDYSIAEGIKTKGQSVAGSTFGGSGIGMQALQIALAQKGKPYVWGATGPNSFDCSGLMQYSYKKVGLDIPRVTYDQMKFGKKLDPKDTASFQPGDLLFPHSGHVVMYAGNGETVEAPQTGDVVKVRKLRPMKYATRPSTEAGGKARAMNPNAGNSKLTIPKQQGDNGYSRNSGLPDKKTIIDTILRGRAKGGSSASRNGSYSSSSVSSSDLRTIATKHSQGSNYSGIETRNKMIDNTRSAVNNNEVVQLLSEIKNSGMNSTKFLGQILEIIAQMLNNSSSSSNQDSTGNAFMALNEIASILRGE